MYDRTKVFSGRAQVGHYACKGTHNVMLGFTLGLQGFFRYQQFGISNVKCLLWGLWWSRGFKITRKLGLIVCINFEALINK